MKRFVIVPVWLALLVLCGALALSISSLMSATARAALYESRAEDCVPTAKACNTQLIQCLGYSGRILDRIDKMNRILYEGLLK
jgi:hypothetical protein